MSQSQLAPGAVPHNGLYSTNKAASAPVRQAPTGFLLLVHAFDVELVVGLPAYTTENHHRNAGYYGNPGQ